MKRNVRIASFIMLISLIGLLSFQAYWISSAYTKKKESLETEIREAFSKANNGLLIRKLGNLSGMEIQVSTEGDFFSADTVVIMGDYPRSRIVQGRSISHTITIDADKMPFSKRHLADTVISEIEGVLGRIGDSFAEPFEDSFEDTFGRSMFRAKGQINESDMSFMDSLLRTYLKPVDLEDAYVLSFGKLGDDEYEFGTGPHALPVSGDKTKSIIQPLSFGVQDKMAKLVYEERKIIKSSLSSIGLIILASVVMICLLVSAWYYIIRSLQRQYQLTQMKDDFINNMTHELKTPVTASSLALEVIAKNDKVKSDDNLQNLIGVARSEQERMLSMIETILESTTQNGLVDEALEILSFNEELEALSETVKMKVKESGGSLLLRIPEKELKIRASQVHLQNAVINILENALKYTEKAPELSVRLEETGKYAQLSITDNGVGISKEDQKRIFEKFFRVSTGDIHTVKGYGLGLSYTKAVIESLEGSIEVQSEPGEGTTFTIKLPLIHEA